ncbi:putative membrane protein [Plasmodium reichenowi]|uniref:Putative membrane protein n=1 Tax=Plasmodium reichenowi TaxID=5854 RepID=A0A151LFP1_PLARE|nr:putative membrane protein [Plasmodium reichenowi]KYN97687.1 putative membrane protein [Plasmodium reichenowi]
MKMEDVEIKQALFKNENKMKGEKCTICKSKYGKFINAFLTWEIVLLIVHILIYLVIIYKFLKDGKLTSGNNMLFRSYYSAGHFTQGFLFVLLLVPFHFKKRIVKYLINTSSVQMCNNGESEIKESFDDIEKHKINNYIQDGDKEEEEEEEEKKKKSSEDIKMMISKGNNTTDKNMDDELTAINSDLNELEKEKYLNDMNIGMNNENKIEANDENIINSLSESFINKLVFSSNTPNHKKKEIHYFFLCAKLFSLNRMNFLFVIKYVSTFILMFAYSLYNIIKRKLRYKYFYYSSYYMNSFDFAAGLLAGGIFVLLYGIIFFCIKLYNNTIKNKNKNFHFYDNYPFINDVKCICDENIKLNIRNNPYLKNIAINYFNSYYNYKNLLFIGQMFLVIICIFSFIFSITSIYAFELNRQ